jgi:hypothetical protein
MEKGSRGRAAWWKVKVRKNGQVTILAKIRKSWE